MSLSRPLMGILLSCIAVLAFASHDSLAKQLAASNGVLMVL